MNTTRTISVRMATLILSGIAGASSLALSGCTVKDTVKTTDDLQAAPGMYGNALNRAHAVAGQEERKSNQGIPPEPGEKANGQ